MTAKTKNARRNSEFVIERIMREVIATVTEDFDSNETPIEAAFKVIGQNFERKADEDVSATYEFLDIIVNVKLNDHVR